MTLDHVLCFPGSCFLFQHLPGEIYLLRLLTYSQKRTDLPHAEELFGQHFQNFRRKLEQTDHIGDLRTALAQFYSQLLLSKAKFRH